MIINGIDTAEISFVVQGPVSKPYTRKCLESIRRNFPRSEIILSTWRGTEVSNLDFDRVVFSEDCDAAVMDQNGSVFNFNRQIVSTKAGLACVQTKYVAKLRSDLLFESPEFLFYFDKFKKYDTKYQKCKSRMIILTLWTRLYFVRPLTFKILNAGPHISDWFAFGFTEDVKKFYSVDLLPDIGDFSGYWLRRKDRISDLPFPNLMLRETPEQFLGANYFGMNDYDDIIKMYSIPVEEVCKFLANNFVVLGYEQSKIYCQKWEKWSKDIWTMPIDHACTFVNYGDFIRFYRKYSDPDFNISTELAEIDKVKNLRTKEIIKNFLLLPVKRNVSTAVSKLKLRIFK